MARISAMRKEFYDYLHSIERIDEHGKKSLRHLSVNAPEIQKLRAMLGVETQTTNTTFLDSDAIRRLCKQRGKSQQTVAKYLGKRGSWLSEALANERMAKRDIDRLAAFFGVPLEEITQ